MSDVNYLSFAGGTGRSLFGATIAPPDPSLYDDLVKFSNEKHFVMSGCKVLSNGTHRENCIDINNLCNDIVISECYLEAGRQNAITIKGGSGNISLSDIIIRPGGNWDIDLGNWSDQSSEQTGPISITRVSRVDGAPVRVRTMWASRPIISESNVKLTVYPKLLVKAYFWLKRHGL